MFTRLLLDEIYHLTELPFDVMFVWLLGDLILRFCYSNLRRETGGFEIASTITLVLQVNGLTKCVSHLKYHGKICAPSFALHLLKIFEKFGQFLLFCDLDIFQQLNPIQDGLIRGCSRMGGGGVVVVQNPPPPS